MSTAVAPVPAVERQHGARTAIIAPLLSLAMPVFNERETIDEIVSRVAAVPLRAEPVMYGSRFLGRHRVFLFTHGWKDGLVAVWVLLRCRFGN